MKRTTAPSLRERVADLRTTVPGLVLGLAFLALAAYVAHERRDESVQAIFLAVSGLAVTLLGGYVKLPGGKSSDGGKGNSGDG